MKEYKSLSDYKSDIYPESTRKEIEELEKAEHAIPKPKSRLTERRRKEIVNAITNG